MNFKNLSTKAIVCLTWIVIGLISIVVGVFISVPEIQTESLALAIVNSSNNLTAAAILQAGREVALLVLKYILVAAGVITEVIATIGLASAMETSELEKLMFDDCDYDMEEGCTSDCSSCGIDCESREYAEEEIEEIPEDAIIDETEEN